MSTGSTKRRGGKKSEEVWAATKSDLSAESPQVATPRREGATPRPDSDEFISERAWLIATLAILMLATALRVYALELKPMHHDEGVNGFFLTNLLRGQGYRYDPSNYHGPTLYYLTLPVVALFGLSTFAVRLVTVAFGIGIVWLVLGLRRRIGAVGALAAAALVAVSPGAVYYSRYYIHETLFVFFTLGIVVAALRFYETRSVSYLLLLSASAAMLFATKETAFISIGTLILAALVSHYWVKLTATAPAAQPATSRARKKKGGDSKEPGSPKLLGDLGGAGGAMLLAAFALFIFLNVVFYSSFFKNWKGVGDALEALKVWSKTGASEFHAKPFYTYVKWLLVEESPSLFLGAAGSAIALFERRKNRFAIFAGAWGFGLLLAYSLIPYKTPWLMLSFVVPLAIAGGYAVRALDRLGPAGTRARIPALVLMAGVLGFSLYQSVVLNFYRYDDDRYPYVYSHSRRELHDLVAEIERLSDRAGRGKETGISVSSPEYWPLPWYLRDYKGVAYESRVSSYYDPSKMAIIIGRESDIAAENQMPRLRTVLGAQYQQIGTYDLRPGVRLALFARRDLVQ